MNKKYYDREIEYYALDLLLHKEMLRCYFKESCIMPHTIHM